MMSNNEIESLIKSYGMKPHPEGGYYIESYKSSQLVTTASGKIRYKYLVQMHHHHTLLYLIFCIFTFRSAGTAIYFLTFGDHVSRLHRLQSDEIWHFYKGSSISVVELVPETGGYKETILGPDLLQYTVKGGTWFGSYPTSSTYSFVGCTVSPGFEFDDFELASRAKLYVEFPNAIDMIDKLTIGLP